MSEFVGLGRMDGPPVEFVHAADVIAMDMRGDREHVMAELVVDQMPERTDPQRRVDHEVEVPSANVPDVAAQERMHVRFGDVGDRVVQALDDEPRIRNG